MSMQATSNQWKSDRGRATMSDSEQQRATMSDSQLKSKGDEIIRAPYTLRTSSTRIKQNTIAQTHGRDYIE